MSLTLFIRVTHAFSIRPIGSNHRRRTSSWTTAGQHFQWSIQLRFPSSCSISILFRMFVPPNGRQHSGLDEAGAAFRVWQLWVASRSSLAAAAPRCFVLWLLFLLSQISPAGVWTVWPLKPLTFMSVSFKLHLFGSSSWQKHTLEHKRETEVLFFFLFRSETL